MLTALLWVYSAFTTKDAHVSVDTTDAEALAHVLWKIIHGQSGAKTHRKRVVDLMKAKEFDLTTLASVSFAQLLSAFKHSNHCFCPRTYTHMLPEDYPKCLAIYHRMQVIFYSG